jgi:hypothetical protein
MSPTDGFVTIRDPNTGATGEVPVGAVAHWLERGFLADGEGDPDLLSLTGGLQQLAAFLQAINDVVRVAGSKAAGDVPIWDPTTGTWVAGPQTGTGGGGDGGPITADQITDAGSWAVDFLTAATQALARAAIGAGDGTWGSLSGKPSFAAIATSGSADDLTGGTIDPALLPSLAVTEFLGTAADETAMLALVGEEGDWTVRTDLGTTWLITGADPTLIGSWQELSYPTAPVTSVAGRTGSVVLTKADVGLSNVANTADNVKNVLTATKLLTARNINGVPFDGTGNITIADGTKVPLTRTVNSKPLSSDIVLTNSDVDTMGRCRAVAGVYPPRPASTKEVVFVGPNPPDSGGTTAGGAGAVANLDIWWVTAS